MVVDLKRIVFFIFYFVFIGDLLMPLFQLLEEKGEQFAAEALLNPLSLFGHLSSNSKQLEVWTWGLHTMLFMPFFPSDAWIRMLYGPSFNGSWALFSVWCWNHYANPGVGSAPEAKNGSAIDWLSDEAIQSASKDLSAWRGIMLHFLPVAVHILYRTYYKAEIMLAFFGYSGKIFQAWTMFVGYMAFYLVWQQVCGSPVAKPDTEQAVGMLGCLIGHFAFTKFLMLTEDDVPQVGSHAVRKAKKAELMAKKKAKTR